MAAPNVAPKSIIQLAFAAGMKSQLDPLVMPEASYRLGLNVVNRGGFITTRPGNSWKVTFPARADGLASNAQGSVHFKTFDGKDYLVTAVDGAVYYSSYPFSDWLAFPVRLRADVAQIHFAVCEQALDTNVDGSVTLITPRRVLIVQDGFSRPIVWDANGQATAINTIPQGTVMAWSGNRLWVADGARLFASDIGDPTAFTETQYIGIGGSFLFPLAITAMSENPDGNQLFVWTESSMHSVASSVRDRLLWQSTPSFIRTLSTTVGCVSSRSVRQQYGMTWWMTRDGLANFNTAHNTYVSSVFPVLDSEMAVSKEYLHGDLTRSCLGHHGNFLLVSVPYGSTRNKHTWVMDGAPLASVTEQTAPPVWASVWTGTNPTSWISGFIADASRCYQVSLDDDGRVSFWESFTDRTDDHGVPISWALETKAYSIDGFSRLEIKRADLRFGNVRGDLDLAVFLAPSHHGAFKRLLTHEAHADTAQLKVGGLVTPVTEISGAAAGQYRQFKTQQPRSTVTLTCDPQTPGLGLGRDSAFSFLLYGLGFMSFTGLRIIYLPDSENMDGDCDKEDGDIVRAVPDGTAFSTEWGDIPFVSEPFLSSATVAGYGGQNPVTVTAASQVSQRAADRLSAAKATALSVTRFLSTETGGGYLPKVRVQTPPAV
jgi:hypothetical protein